MLLPLLWFFLSRRSHLVALNALEKLPRQPLLTRMALSMHRAKIQKLIRQRISFIGLIQNRLQRAAKFA